MMKLISLSLVAGILGAPAQEQGVEYSVDEPADGIQVVYRGHALTVPGQVEEDSRYDDKWDYKKRKHFRKPEENPKWDIHPYKPPPETHCRQEPESKDLVDEYREAHVEAMKRIRKIPSLMVKSVGLAKEIAEQQKKEFDVLFTSLTSRKIDNKNQRDCTDVIQFWFEKAERELQRTHQDFLENFNALLFVTRKKALSLSVSADNSDVPQSAHDLKVTLKRFEADEKPALTELVTSLSTFSQKVNNWYYEKLDEPYKAEKLKKEIVAKRKMKYVDSYYPHYKPYYSFP